MRMFYVETENGIPLHDFSFQLLQGIRYQNWYRDRDEYGFITSEQTDHCPEGAIPIGSLEFVGRCLVETTGKGLPKPLQIPLELREERFLKREYQHRAVSGLVLDRPMFVKSLDQYKGFTDVTDDVAHIEAKAVAVSEVVSFTSEWRTFVFEGKIVGLHPYAGDPLVFPDAALVCEIVDVYKTAPRAYTLDVGVTDRGTCVIEVHPFVSCGLYGFQDLRILLQMFIQGYRSISV